MKIYKVNFMSLDTILYWIRDYKKLNGDNAPTFFLYEPINIIQDLCINDNILEGPTIFDENFVYDKGSQYDNLDIDQKNIVKIKLSSLLFPNLN